MVKTPRLLLFNDNIEADIEDMSHTINPLGNQETQLSRSNNSLLCWFLGRLFHILTVISWGANPDL